jgi:hypothetical protein
MSLNRHISVNQVFGLAVTFVALVMAVYFGSLVGNQEFGTMTMILLAFLGVLYFAFASAYWIWLAFVWAVFGFLIRPLGPTLSGLHIALALAGMFIAAYAWRRHPAGSVSIQLNTYFRPFKLSLLIYLCYMAVNAILTMFFPNEPLSVRWANLAKQNVEMWGGFISVALALAFPRFCRLPKGIGNWMVGSVMVALLVNTLIRGYATFVLGLGQQAEAGTLAPELGATTISLPVLNLVDNEFILRAIAPFGALLGVALLCAKSASGKPAASRLLTWLLVATSIVAAPFAGGRVTLLLTLLMPSLVLWLRKRYVALFLIGACGVLVLVGIRYTYETNYKLVPFMVQRSVALVPGMQMDEALRSIEGSSEWRYDLATRALAEWRTNFRTLLLGRGVYAFTVQDVTAIHMDPHMGMLESSLLRGATHNSITDHLLITGLIGLVLYHTVLFTLLYGVYNILRHRRDFDCVSALCLVVLIESVVLFLAGFLGSGFFLTTGGLLTACIIVLTTEESASGAYSSRLE